MVYQELSAFLQLSIAENMFGRRLPTKYGFIDWRRTRHEAQQHMHALGLDIDVGLTMGSLSVGHQQLVEIARVIFSGANILVLDEPTSALSAPETRRLFEFLLSLKRQGKTIVFISHFLDEVLKVTDRISILRNGRHAATLLTKGTDKDELVELMIGQALNEPETPDAKRHITNDAAVSEADRDGRDVLVARGLTLRAAFSDVSLTIKRGEIVGLFAFMGAGQAELARCLFGAQPLDRGDIFVGDKRVALKSTGRAKAAGIAFVPEDRRKALMLEKEMFKNITLAHLREIAPLWVRKEREIEVARDQIDSAGIRPADPFIVVGALSGGHQQKVVLAKWLTRRPKVLILSEPTRGMDVGAKQEVVSIMRRLKREGVAILLITTEPETVIGIADRALVMRKGRITAELDRASLSKEALMRSA
jgi:ribose transport system ATP-binding protein